MSNVRMRLQTGILALILLPAAGSVVAIHASQTCERFVRTYVSKPVRNRVSKQTAEAWAKWRIAHPNWKPNPNIHRPKYVMTREEAVEKVDFACTMPTIPSPSNLFFTAADFEGPPPIVDLPPMDATQINFPDVIPPEVAEMTPETTDNSWPPFFPLIPPILGSGSGSGGGSTVLPLTPPPPPPVGEVPEPPSYLLVALGIGSLWFLVCSKGRWESKGR